MIVLVDYCLADIKNIFDIHMYLIQKTEYKLILKYLKSISVVLLSFGRYLDTQNEKYACL